MDKRNLHKDQGWCEECFVEYEKIPTEKRQDGVGSYGKHILFGSKPNALCGMSFDEVREEILKNPIHIIKEG